MLRILARILRRHALFHLLIPLLVGVSVEALYSLTVESVALSALPSTLLSLHRIVLYIGIFVAYMVVIGILIQQETNISLEQLHRNVLADRLQGTKGVFAIGTMRFDEWFDPAVQTYLATIAERKLCDPKFRYERVLLLGSRSAEKDLRAYYLDGYYAKCLAHIHERLGIQLYYLKEAEIFGILGQLSAEEKVHVGFYPTYMAYIPGVLIRLLIWPVRHRRVRKVAVVVIEAADGSKSVFRFSKHDKIVQVKFELPEHVATCVKFVQLIQQKIYKQGTTEAQTEYDFIKYIA